MAKKAMVKVDHPKARKRLRYRLRREQYRMMELEAMPPAEAPPPPEQAAHGHGHGHGGHKIDHAHKHELEKTIETLRDQCLRLQAEFDNFRKRVAREREQTVAYAGQRVMEALLPVLDNFRRAVQSPGESVELFLSGVAMVEKQLEDILAQQGLERIEAEGQPFDPNVHEAVGVVEGSGLPDNTVAEVLQSGFALKGRLLRPAMVKVARAS